MNKKATIIWSALAREAYLDILNHILTEWTIREATDFDDKVESLLARLKTNTKLCPKSQIKKLRKCVITLQTSLIYRLNDNVIEIVIFVDNRSLHNY
ncbi:MAG: type II toxin-antitoxin system RelE/ParE family toxin [Bacteroidales bacterium]|nr:type II toxin-antitoxin system RelE/ParE family toxin [Bacteroidales bacterium]